METQKSDLTIIGAGWHGLAAAKSALALDPTVNLVVLDSAASVGGVWAEERLYPALRTNNLLGSYEYGDFPMRENIPGLVTPGQHISGRAMHEYLKAYALHFGIGDKIKLNCKVESVEYLERDDGRGKEWLIKWKTTTEPGHEKSSTTRTRKLILATGLTSQPHIPTFSGQESFGALMFHAKEFALYQDTIFGDPSNDKPGVQHESAHDDHRPITVLGGSKSAWDTVYACASKGHRVNWVIRASGMGPTWVTPAAVFSPFNLLLESLPLVRALGWFSPCVWVSHPIRNFLHGTWLGCMIVRLFWACLQWDMVRVNRYSDHEETAKLKPWVDPFWVGTAVSIINFPGDVFALIRGGLVKVHIADVERLEPCRVVLNNGGDSLETKALIMCTGWKLSPGIRFLPDGIDQEMGFSWTADPIDQGLVKQAQEDISTCLPMLPTGPESRTYNKKDMEDQINTDEAVLHPLRLARFIVPLGLWDDHSIAFLGALNTFSTSIVAEVQALWALVYLNHGSELHQHGNKESRVRETALHTEFCSLRSPMGHGVRTPDFVFEVMPYLDLLLGDLGMSTSRKGSWWEDLFVPHRPRDYAGLVEEWKMRLRLSIPQERRKIKNT
ncbi:monooxygenase [Penicillium brevicompactum]|uniref:monooxygenase n=1 Tax=Penicillium brevicompactum TaxID=5074 RepID=UPI0025411FA3|nr:monooxygenase [Penicillium brevicompactum]KAJ5337277.1 monooxygenase [Penicillium brevicompactum]